MLPKNLLSEKETTRWWCVEQLRIVENETALGITQNGDKIGNRLNSNEAFWKCNHTKYHRKKKTTSHKIDADLILINGNLSIWNYRFGKTDTDYVGTPILGEGGGF